MKNFGAARGIRYLHWDYEIYLEVSAERSQTKRGSVRSRHFVLFDARDLLTRLDNEMVNVSRKPKGIIGLTNPIFEPFIAIFWPFSYYTRALSD